MNKLTEIGTRMGTDKAYHHEFTEFYQDYFYKFKEPKVLEIGIADGGSLKMYDEFWEGKANIVGIDISDKSGYFRNNKQIKVLVGDILAEDSLPKIKAAIEGGMYDIIIDDGGHTMKQQQETLKKLWSLLKPGGIFIVEDLHTSSMAEYNPDGTIPMLDVLKNMSNGTEVDTKYLSAEEQKAMNKEMESILIWEKDFPQVHLQPPRVSITSVIVKTNTELLAGDPVINVKAEESKEFPPTILKIGESTIIKAPEGHTIDGEKPLEHIRESQEYESKIPLDAEEKDELTSIEKLFPKGEQALKYTTLNQFYRYVINHPTHSKRFSASMLQEAIADFIS